MSVQSKVYIGVYVKLDDYEVKVDCLTDEQYDDMVCGVEDEEFSLIEDGMCGDYTYFGITLDELETESDHQSTDIEIENIKIHKDDVIERALELFGKQNKHWNPKLTVFTHYY